jgi:hypothetical protein
MKDTIFLLVKVTISTTHQNVHEAIAELQQSATCIISNTKKVKVIQTRFMDYKLKSK